MPSLNHDSIERRIDGSAHGVGKRRSRIRRLSSWLWRRLGRQCASGFWTLSPDGKLNCESLQAESRQPD
jgi:hypothetical protein